MGFVRRASMGALGTLDTLAPPLAAVVAARLWFRLPPPAPAERRRRRQAGGGRPFEVVGDGLTVRGLVYGGAGDSDTPDGGPRHTAYLVHGWGGHWQQLAALAEALRDQGYRVVVHDAPSHGDSPAGRFGRRSTRVMEMARAHALVAGRHGEPALTVAHSLGVMAVLWAARHHGTRLGALVAVASATDLEAMVDVFRGAAGLGPRSRTALLDRIEQRIGHPREAFGGPALAAAVLADQGPVPLLAVHDSGDEESPARVSEELVGAWPGAELLVTDGLGHRRVLWSPEVVGQVARFASRQHDVARRAPAR